MSLRENFGEAVRRRRNELRLTQQDLARVLNVTQAYVALIEGGRQNSGFDTVERFAKALKCEPLSLLGVQAETGSSV